MLNKSLLSTVISSLLAKPEKVESIENINDFILADIRPTGITVDLDSVIDYGLLRLEQSND